MFEPGLFGKCGFELGADVVDVIEAAVIEHGLAEFVEDAERFGVISGALVGQDLIVFVDQIGIFFVGPLEQGGGFFEVAALVGLGCFAIGIDSGVRVGKSHRRGKCQSKDECCSGEFTHGSRPGLGSF